jgi:AmpD protein
VSFDRPIAINAENGWIESVRCAPSPNCDDRPAGCIPELLVVHGISLPPGQFGGPWIARLFSNRLCPEEHEYFASIAHLRVSAHVLISRSGELTQFVPFSKRAWHAGESEYCGRRQCNDYSIGIELEGTDDRPYERSQYEALATLIEALRHAYPSLRSAEVVGHCDIAPGRKTDPGPMFDWQLLASLIARLDPLP